MGTARLDVGKKLHGVPETEVETSNLALRNASHDYKYTHDAFVLYQTMCSLANLEYLEHSIYKAGYMKFCPIPRLAMPRSAVVLPKFMEGFLAQVPFLPMRALVHKFSFDQQLEVGPCRT